jgi:hypothetical protein
VPFFTQMIEQISQITFRPTGDDVCSSLIFRGIEPHVEWPFSLKAQSTLCTLQLVGRKAQVSEHGIHTINLQFIQYLPQLIEIGMHQIEPWLVRYLFLLFQGPWNSAGITIQTYQSPGGTQFLSKQAGMSGTTERSIHYNLARFWGQQLQHLPG